jgi:hypothetical protein
MRRIHIKAYCHAVLSSLYFPSSTFASLSEDLQLLLDFTLETIWSTNFHQASLAEGSSSHLHGRDMASTQVGVLMYVLLTDYRVSRAIHD